MANFQRALPNQWLRHFPIERASAVGLNRQRVMIGGVQTETTSGQDDMTDPSPTDIAPWRKTRRAELVAARVDMPLALRREQQAAVTRHLAGLVSAERNHVIAGYWPFKGEYDPRPMLRVWRSLGAVLALPLVVERAAPMEFRRWERGVKMERGVLGIPVPQDTAVVVPDVLLIPLLGFDAAGYRLGIGGGYFDRTLAAMTHAPLKIGVGYECGRLQTIHPQWHDIPMDAIVTEAGVQRFTPADRPAAAS